MFSFKLLNSFHKLSWRTYENKLKTIRVFISSPKQPHKLLLVLCCWTQILLVFSILFYVFFICLFFWLNRLARGLVECLVQFMVWIMVSLLLFGSIWYTHSLNLNVIYCFGGWFCYNIRRQERVVILSL